MEKKYNNWPATSKLNVKPLAKGEVAHYRLLNTYNKKTKKYSLRTQFIGTKATVSDPDTGEIYEAAFVRTWKANGDAELGDISFEPTMMCHLHLRWDSVEHQKMYQFLEISNENLSNKNRDTNIDPMFERVTEDTDSISERQIRKDRQRALNVIDEMSDEDISAYFRANALPDPGSHHARRNKLEEYAEQDPDKFLNGSIVAGLGDLVLEVENWVENGVINYDRPQAIWFTNSGKVLLKLTKSFHSDPKMELAKFLAKHDEKVQEMRDVLDEILADRRASIVKKEPVKPVTEPVKAEPKKNPFQKKTAPPPEA